jgi:hypothetical protein
LTTPHKSHLLASAHRHVNGDVSLNIDTTLTTTTVRLHTLLLTRSFPYNTIYDTISTTTSFLAVSFNPRALIPESPHPRSVSSDVADNQHGKNTKHLKQKVLYPNQDSQEHLDCALPSYSLLHYANLHQRGWQLGESGKVSLKTVAEKILAGFKTTAVKCTPCCSTNWTRMITELHIFRKNQDFKDRRAHSIEC